MAKIVYINSDCNQRCIFCLGRYRNNGLSTVRKLPILLKNELLVISGGETTLSPDIFKILALAKKMHINNVELQTNAMTLAYPNLCRKLFDCGVREFNVNMPAHSDGLNDRITLTPGSLKLRLSGLKNLMHLGAKIRLTFVINKLNYATMRDYCCFVKNNLAQVSRLAFNFVQIVGAVKDNHAIVPRLSEIKPHLLKALNYAVKLQRELITDNIPLCILGEKKYFCFSVDYRKSLLGKEMARVERTLNLAKSFILACAKCIYRKNCGGIRNDYLKLYGEKEFHPFLTA